jgi:Domain of unknown function (DU1801)
VAKYEPKTKPDTRSVAGFIAKIRDAERRADCRRLVRMMKTATGKAPRMWATMIGFGKQHYKYASGHEGDCFVIGFASRKPDLVLYLMCGRVRSEGLLKKLGKHRASVSCIYVRRLADVDEAVLARIINAAVRDSKSVLGNSCS